MHLDNLLVSLYRFCIGGDPTGTGRGGTSIYGDRFADEIVRSRTGRVLFLHLHAAESRAAVCGRRDISNGKQRYALLTLCDCL